MSRASVFDLPRKPVHLASANDVKANARYRQISATKDVSQRQFAQGVQQFRWDTSGNTWFLPSMSYFRLRCSLTQVREQGGDPLPILSRADIAPNMGLASNLFKSVELQLNGQTLERVSERLPQVDALKTRMQNTNAWLDQLGRTTNFWDSEFTARREQVAVDGYESKHHTNEPVFGAPLTQVQAGFHVNHLIQYNPASYIFQCDANNAAPVDIENGPMALRVGDRMLHGEIVLEIKCIIDATHGMAHVFKGGIQGRRLINDGNNPPAGNNGWSFQKLRQATSNQALGKNSFEVIWRPPLGLFDLDHAIPPGGEWLIEFNPANSVDFRKNAIESLRNDIEVVRHPHGAAQFDFRGEEFQFYLYVMDAQRFDSGEWLLDLQQTRCQSQNMPADCTSLVQKNFDVPGKTTHLTLAFQDQSEGSDTRYSRSKLKIRPAPFDPLRGRVDTHEGQDLLLERFFIQYGTQQKPTPDFDGRFSSVQGDTTQPQTNYLVHRYVDSLMQADLFHTEGGADSFKDWLRRGPYYHFRWPKDGVEQSTRVSINFKFSQTFADNLQHQIVLFSQWRSAYKIKHKNGPVDISAFQEL